MPAAKLIWRRSKKFYRDLEKYDQKRIKAAETAVRIEAYRLSDALREDLKKGASGGRVFSPLTAMAKRGRKKNARPLSKLHGLVKYKVSRPGGKFTASVGFVNPGRGGPVASSKMKRVIKKHQRGFSSYVSKVSIDHYEKPGRVGIVRLGLTKRGKKRTTFWAPFCFFEKLPEHFGRLHGPLSILFGQLTGRRQVEI